MTTQAQAVDTAHRWINGDLSREHVRAVHCHEFDLGWVVWPEPSPVQVDPLSGARRAPEEIGAACGVVDRVTGALTVWPSVPVPEVIRLYRDRLGAGTYDPVLPPITGPGARATLTYRDGLGEERTLVVESAPGLPHPALRAWQQLRQQGGRPEDVLALHTDLRMCMLPGGYWPYLVDAELPDVKLTFDLAYGPRHDRRAAAVRVLVGSEESPGGPRLNRVPFPLAVPPAQPESEQALAERLAGQFGPQGVRRFEAAEIAAVAELPEAAARLLLQVGLPAEVPGFFTLYHPESDGVLDGTPTARALPELAAELAADDLPAYATAADRAAVAGQVVLGTDGWSLITLGTADGLVHAVDPAYATVRYGNADLTAFTRCLALLADRHPRLRGLTPQEAGPVVAELQWGLAALDRTVFSDPENWWSVIIEQLWHGLL